MHTREIIEPGELPRFHLDGEIVGDWCWLPFRGIDEQTLFGWLVTADMRYETQWTAASASGELVINASGAVLRTMSRIL